MPRPDLTCCTAYSAPTPIGYRWCHSWSCPTSNRGQIVRVDRHIEALVDSRHSHPAGSALEETWGDHDIECDCEPVCRYVNAWMDRDDDRSLERVSW